jgi:hypothetical protein
MRSAMRATHLGRMERPCRHLCSVPEKENQNTDQDSHHGSAKKKAQDKKADRPRSRNHEVKIEEEIASQHEKDKDSPSSDNPHRQGTQKKVANPHRCDEPVLQRFAPHVIEQGISHVELTHLYSAHGDHAHENERFCPGLKGRELSQKPHRKESDNGPEKDLEKGEDVSLGHHPVFESECSGLG